MIRPYIDSDKPALLNLWEEFDREHIRRSERIFRLPDAGERDRRHEKYAHGTDPLLLVCEDNGELSGFLAGQFRRTPDVALLRERTILELHAIYVEPRERDGDRSEALVRAALNAGKARCADEAVCHIWAFNTRAEALVERMGFSVMSRKYGIPLGDGR